MRCTYTGGGCRGGVGLFTIVRCPFSGKLKRKEEEKTERKRPSPSVSFSVLPLPLA